jgi:hypothetical protein
LKFAQKPQGRRRAVKKIPKQRASQKTLDTETKKKRNEHKKGGYFWLTNLNQSDRFVLFATQIEYFLILEPRICTENQYFTSSLRILFKTF